MAVTAAGRWCGAGFPHARGRPPRLEEDRIVIAHLALVGVGFVVAAVIGAPQLGAQEERERVDALRRLDHPRF